MSTRHTKTSLVWLLSLILIQLLIAGCMTKAKVTNARGGPDMNEAKMAGYNGPRARVAVARFTDKTGGKWYNRKIGQGMADQLTTALVNTGRFIVLDRQNLDAIVDELGLGQSGLVKDGTAPKMGKIEGVELLIVAAVTGFKEQSGGASPGNAKKTDGKVKKKIKEMLNVFRKTHMEIDLRVIDTETSRILAATSVQGSARDVDPDTAVGEYLTTVPIVDSLSGWENTPKEKALRAVIDEAVEFIVSKTPQQFYRVGQQSGGHNRKNREMVKSMQEILGRLGYDVGTPDGIAGKQTKAAVRAFQQKNDLPITGRFDNATVEALRSML